MCYTLILLLIGGLIYQIIHKGIFGKLVEEIINNAQYFDTINTVGIFFAIPVFMALIRLWPKIIKMTKI